MAELVNSDRSRAVFAKNKQGEFLRLRRKESGLTFEAFARLLSVSPRTLTDWQRERFLIPLNAVETICKKTGHRLPEGIEVRKQYWYVTKGARVGGEAMYRKYGVIGGDQEVRKQKWREWWEREGRFKQHPIINKPRSIREPKKCESLAEFVGIVLGDGGISQYQVIITLNSNRERAYGEFILQLCRELFGVSPALYQSKKFSAFDIAISRAALVRYLATLGMNRGNKIKRQAGVPSWISESRAYRIACLRGLMDTEGSLFMHRYRVKGRWYSYPKLSFSNRSKPLLDFVHKTLLELGFRAKISYPYWDVRINSQNEVKRYFDIVGTHNSKYSFIKESWRSAANGKPTVC